MTPSSTSAVEPGTLAAKTQRGARSARLRLGPLSVDPVWPGGRGKTERRT